MRFEDALQLHHKGKDIKRAGWRYVIGPESGNIEVNWDDIIAEDWQEAEESPRRTIVGW